MNATQYQLLILAAEQMLAKLPGQELTFTLTAQEALDLRERRAQLKLDHWTDAVAGTERYTFSLKPESRRPQDVSSTTNEADSCTSQTK